MNGHVKEIKHETSFLSSLSSLPEELLGFVFSFLPVDVLYDKFLGSSNWDELSLSDLQLFALRFIFTKSLVIRSNTSRMVDFWKIVYPNNEIKQSMLCYGFIEGYQLMRKLFNYNFRLDSSILPKDITLLFKFSDRSFQLDIPAQEENENALTTEIEYFIMILELLAFDNFYKDRIKSINFHLIYDINPTPNLMLNQTRIMQRIEMLSRKSFKLVIYNRNKIKWAVGLNPFQLESLRELYLWNSGFNDFNVVNYFHGIPPHLKILHLTGNDITSLHGLVIPATLEQLMVTANNITSLEGPNFQDAPNLQVFDASINAVTELTSRIKFNNNLKTFRIPYNRIQNIRDFELPKNLQTLSLSKNLLTQVDNINLPLTLTELFLNGNYIKSLPDYFFSNCENLTKLSLSDNLIDDLDDLGNLPSSLEELILDNNEIDNNDLTNILSLTKLKYLSMISTGLISINGNKFPKTLQVLKLDKNELSELINIDFGNNLIKLNLAGNNLNKFNIEQYKLKFPPSLQYLDLSNNPLEEIDTLFIPRSVQGLQLNGVNIPCNNHLLSHIPRGIQELELNNTGKIQHCPLLDFASYLPNLKSVNMEGNHIVSMEQMKFPYTLERLNLASNLISIIPFGLIPKNIKYLQFNNNHVSLEGLKFPVLPQLEYFGICGDQTNLMRQT
ncbi:hypothetical protein JA1_003019 [Spathaspora sp. JA1]|nr:hypothetical protein JA1_003019 [Spathaspora sp. JA1]